MAVAGSMAAPEWGRWPRLVAVPKPPLGSLLAGGYVGFTEATSPRRLVLPATTSVPLVVKLVDSAHRPPAFVRGPQRGFSVMEGDCARSYLELLLTPLGAYRLLGLPMGQLSGQLVDLVEVLGPAGRRLAEQLRETASWGRRFGLVDGFLLGRLEEGPQPSPEVGWAWGRLAAEAGYADQAHLVRDFHQFTGTTPTAFAAWTPPDHPVPMAGPRPGVPRRSR
jgi:Bacterial regulatory helix-turn-helix proteins, AraC family